MRVISQNLLTMTKKINAPANCSLLDAENAQATKQTVPAQRCLIHRPEATMLPKQRAHQQNIKQRVPPGRVIGVDNHRSSGWNIGHPRTGDPESAKITREIPSNIETE
jgi:hypothetical protein